MSYQGSVFGGPAGTADGLQLLYFAFGLPTDPNANLGNLSSLTNDPALNSYAALGIWVLRLSFGFPGYSQVRLFEVGFRVGTPVTSKAEMGGLRLVNVPIYMSTGDRSDDPYNVTLFQVKINSTNNAAITGFDQASVSLEGTNTFKVTHGSWGIVGSADFGSLDANLAGDDLKSALPRISHNGEQLLGNIVFGSTSGEVTLSEVKAIGIRADNTFKEDLTVVVY